MNCTKIRIERCETLIHEIIFRWNSVVKRLLEKKMTKLVSHYIPWRRWIRTNNSFGERIITFENFCIHQSRIFTCIEWQHFVPFANIWSCFRKLYLFQTWFYVKLLVKFWCVFLNYLKRWRASLIQLRQYLNYLAWVSDFYINFHFEPCGSGKKLNSLVIQSMRA